MDALLISTDLMAISKVGAAATLAGVEVPSASPNLAIEKLSNESPRLVLIDLTAPVADIERLVNQIRDKAPQAKLLAFGPHVHETKLAAAESAGCDHVIPRGAFHKQLDSLLANLKQA